MTDNVAELVDSGSRVGPTVEEKPSRGRGPNRRRTVIVVLVGAAVALIVLLGLLSGVVAGPGVETGQKSTRVTTVPVQTFEPPSHGETLRAIAAQDRSQVALLADQWVPQIASRKENEYGPGGLDARTEHAQLTIRFSRALLVWSGDYTSFCARDYRVTIVGIPFETAAGANSWCDAVGRPPDDCYAKYISSTVGSRGTSVFRH